jgi:hypothetical protein
MPPRKLFEKFLEVQKPNQAVEVIAGMNTRSPKANAWIEKKASEIGLEGNQFVSAFAYAGNDGWLADAPRMGWTLLTSAGEAIAKR